MNLIESLHRGYTVIPRQGKIPSEAFSSPNLTILGNFIGKAKEILDIFVAGEHQTERFVFFGRDGGETNFRGKLWKLWMHDAAVCLKVGGWDGRLNSCTDYDVLNEWYFPVWWKASYLKFFFYGPFQAGFLIQIWRWEKPSLIIFQHNVKVLRDEGVTFFCIRFNNYEPSIFSYL